MIKLDNKIANNIKILSLDMISEARSGDSYLALSSSKVFSSLFLYHLNYNNKKPLWEGRDRLVLSYKLLPSLYSSLYLFSFDLNIDNLKDYKKFGSKTLGYNADEFGVNVSYNSGDSLGIAAGISLGERYLNKLSKNLVDYKTYVICTYDDIMSGSGYEALSFISREKLNKLVIIVLKDNMENDITTDMVYNENLNTRFKSLDFNIIDVDEAKFGQIDEAIDDAKESKKPSVVLVNIDYNQYKISDKYNNLHNEPLNEDDINNIRMECEALDSFNVSKELLNEIKDNINKRLIKIHNKWEEKKNSALNNEEMHRILNFIIKKDINININYENLKINDTYNEELVIGNSKIFNIFASKSKFVLGISDDNFKNTLCNINKSSLMSDINPTGRNLLLGGRTLLMGTVSIGLATLGFKVFVSTNLCKSDQIRSYIKYSAMNNLNITYIFTNDNFLDTYNDSGISAIDEINSLRLIPNLINFRPADINEIIGIYHILGKEKYTSTIILCNEKVQKLAKTSPKYVIAGMYRVLKEEENANGILIASGSEVAIAIKIAKELIPYNINLRVISAPSVELFENQNDKYKNMLIPRNVKTFVLEYSKGNYWCKYATDSSYILGIDKYSTNGSRNELLKYHNLDIDSIKTTIVEKYKS